MLFKVRTIEKIGKIPIGEVFTVYGISCGFSASTNFICYSPNYIGFLELNIRWFEPLV